MALQLHHGVVVTRFERKVTVLDIALHQPSSFQKPRNPVTYGMHECLELLDVTTTPASNNVELLKRGGIITSAPGFPRYRQQFNRAGGAGIPGLDQ